jgi:hypothetical protein
MNQPTGPRLYFVIMPIGSEGSKARKDSDDAFDLIIQPAISEFSVEIGGFPFECLRADKVCEANNIVKDIARRLNDADVVIADLTGQNANVFYELGVRHALIGRTIMIARSLRDVPFDLRNYRVIAYDLTARGAARAKKAIKEYLGGIEKNPKGSDNPVQDSFEGRPPAKTKVGNSTASDEAHQEVKVVTTQRIEYEGEYSRLRAKAKIHDVVSVGLTGALRNYYDSPRLLKKVLLYGTRVRLMFVNPLAPFVKQRAKEDGQSEPQLQKQLKESVALSRKIFDKLYEARKKYKNLPHERTGGFEIRVIDVCPYFTIFRADDKLLWGIYTCHQRGNFSALLRVKLNGGLGEQLRDHVDKLWNTHENNWIVRYHIDGEPLLNTGLIEKLLSRKS